MQISECWIYPIKSCAGIKVDSLTLHNKLVENDRNWMMIDRQGRFITQRECVQLAKVQPKISDDKLNINIDGEVFSVPLRKTFKENDEREVTIWGDTPWAYDEGNDVAQWLSEKLAINCRLVRLHDKKRRLVDQSYADPRDFVGFADGFPLLVVNQRSLDALSNKSGVEIDVRRFRPNIVITDNELEAFAEREWGDLAESNGHYTLSCVKPCERCVIPTRDPDSLERTIEVISAMRELCTIDNRIIFGQNAVISGYSASTLKIHVGDRLVTNP